jgi:hypothetical protein
MEIVGVLRPPVFTEVPSLSEFTVRVLPDSPPLPVPVEVQPLAFEVLTVLQPLVTGS